MERRGTARIGIDIGSVCVHAYAVTADGRTQGFASPIRGRALDVLQSLRFLGQRPEVDGRRIALVGWGEGGLLALSAAALDPIPLPSGMSF